MSAYTVRCLDSKYDSAEQFIVLNCIFEHTGEKKIICFSKNDFNFHGDVVPDSEMEKTAAMFSGKRFNIEISDDPMKKNISPENYASSVKEINSNISNEMGLVQDGLANERQQIERKIGKLDQEGKIDILKLIQNEKAINEMLNKIL